MTEPTPPSRPPRIGWRLLVIAALAAWGAVTALGQVLTESTTCRTDAACRWLGPIVTLNGFGGAFLLLVSAVAWALLRDARPRRAVWPANASIVLCCVFLLALPVYDVFRDGVSGATSEGRARRHREARQRLVEVLDGTAAAVAPGVRADPVDPELERDTEGSEVCEYERYVLSLPEPRVRDRVVLLEKVAAHWRSLGFAVTGVPSHGGVYVEAGDLRFSASSNPGFSDVRLYGAGPCLKIG